MAPFSSMKQNRPSHETRKNSKGSSKSHLGQTSGSQVQSSQNAQNSNQGTYFNVPRKRSTWPDLDSLAQKAADTAATTSSSSHSQLSPMERWEMETSQSPWNDISAVKATSWTWSSKPGEKNGEGSHGGSTDKGT